MVDRIKRKPDSNATQRKEETVSNLLSCTESVPFIRSIFSSKF